MEVARRVMYSFILLIITTIAYTVYYPERPAGYLILSSSSTSLSVLTIILNVDGGGLLTKDAQFSADDKFREHVIPLKLGSYSGIKIKCNFPDPKINKCLINNLTISDINKKEIRNLSSTLTINNGSEADVSLGSMVLESPSKIDNFYVVLLHLLPVYFVIFIIMFLPKVKFNQIRLYCAIAFSLMFFYSMVVYSSVATGMDAIENINVAKNLMHVPHYISYVEYRGYMWFFILWLLNCISSGLNISLYYCFAIYGSLVFAILTTILLPNILKHLCYKKISLYNQIALAIVLAYLFGKQFFCPIPDVTPFLFLVLAVSILISNRLNCKIVILAGVCLSIACLVRSNYYLSVICLISWLLFNCGHTFYKRLHYVLLLILPLVFLAFTNKLFIDNSNIPLSNTYLTQAVLYNGMNVQKTSPFEINDSRGKKILSNEGISSAKELTVRKYLGLLLKYPIDFMTMYSIRLFNGLDIKYSQVYVSEVGSRVLFSLVNYIFLFFGLSKLIRINESDDENNKKYFFIMAIALPCLAMVSSFVETRYFLPLQVMLVSMGCATLNLNFFRNFKRIVKLLLFVICCFMISASVYNQSNLILF